MSAMKGPLWYIARGDLSRPGNAEALHSREDVRGLRQCGWDAVLFSSASGEVETPDGIQEVIVQSMNAPLERLRFELIMISWLLRANPKPAFVFFRGPTNLILIALALKLLHIPFGVELNGVFGYRYEPRWRIRHWFERPIDRYFMKHSRVIIGVTEELSALAARECRKGAIIATARNAVNIEQIKPVAPRPTQFDLQIGFLGKAFQARGLDIMLEMIHELRRRGVDAAFRAVGGGPEIQKLEAKAHALGLADVVEFHAAVPPETMADAMADCHLMCAYFDDWDRYHLTGLSPLKIWTYLALGKPVFIRDPGVLDAYRKVPGLLWGSGSDGKSIADELLRYWAQYGKEGLARLGKEGRCYVENNVSWAKHAEIINQAISILIK